MHLKVFLKLGWVFLKKKPGFFQPWKQVNKALDTKERSRARKEAVESKRDKKSLALDVLKAKRKEKQELQQKKVTAVLTLFIEIEIHWFRFLILILIK